MLSFPEDSTVYDIDISTFLLKNYESAIKVLLSSTSLDLYYDFDLEYDSFSYYS